MGGYRWTPNHRPQHYYERCALAVELQSQKITQGVIRSN